jgi:hypothetical protein
MNFMFCLWHKLLKFSAVISLLIGFPALSSTAQTSQQSDEAEVSVIQSVGQNRYGCYMETGIVDEAALKKLGEDKDCASLAKSLKVDFAKHTLISYHTNGDCFLRATAKVFRSKAAKKYTVRIKNIWGGCRAAGSFQGWLVIEKIPSGYTLSFAVARVTWRDEKAAGEYFELDSPSIKKPETLETRAIDLKGCIHTYFQRSYVIRDEETYLKAIRNDASRPFCLKNVEKIDFTKHTLLGIEINSGYCRVPEGLTYKTIKDSAKKQYLLEISYLDPGYATCRALSQYDLWVLIPKLPEGYEAEFKVKAIAREEQQ